MKFENERGVLTSPCARWVLLLCGKDFRTKNPLPVDFRSRFLLDKPVQLILAPQMIYNSLSEAGTCGPNIVCVKCS